MLHLHEIGESIKMALGTVRAHKLRSFLTILGVLIGVTSIILMVSIIEGFNSSMTEQIEGLGSSIIYVAKYEPGIQFGRRSAAERNRPDMTFEDAEAILKYCPSVEAVSPQNYYTKPGGNIAKYKSYTAKNFAFFGTLPGYEVVNSAYVESGRFLTDTDIKYRAFVAVIGVDVRNALFPGIDPIGKEILVNEDKFTVIGVMEERQTVMGSGENNFILISYGAYEKIHPEETALWLMCRAYSPDVMQQAQDEVIDLMRRRHGLKYHDENDFAVFTQESLMDIYNQITQAIWLVMIVISSIGLLVGGVGVMNIMLVSVTERTKEIGIRKAVGAKRLSILWQFLIEAMVLSGLGGILGILIGLGLSQMIAAISPLPAVVSIPWIIIGFSFSVGVALVFGIYPAARASRLDPIECLHYE